MSGAALLILGGATVGIGAFFASRAYGAPVIYGGGDATSPLDYDATPAREVIFNHDGMPLRTQAEVDAFNAEESARIARTEADIRELEAEIANHPKYNDEQRAALYQELDRLKGTVA